MNYLVVKTVLTWFKLLGKLHPSSKGCENVT